MSMVAPVRKGEQVTARRPLTSKAWCSDSISDAAGQLHVCRSRRHPHAGGGAQLRRGTTAGTCLVTASLSAARGEGVRVAGDSRRPREREQTKGRARCMGSAGGPSHSLFKRRGEEGSPSISTGTRAGAAPEPPVRRPGAGTGGSLRQPLCRSPALGPHEALKLPTLESSAWSAGSSGECYRQARGEETGLLVSIPELFRAQSDIWTKASEAISDAARFAS